MTPLQQLQSKIQKAKYPCGECWGGGESGYPETLDDGHITINKEQCKNCKGTGTDIPLEFGCEILMSYYKKNTKYIFLGDSKGHVLNSGTYQKGGVFYCIRDTAIQPTQKDYDDIIQNLGKPIDLQDILLALVSKDVQIKLFKEQIQIAKFYGFQKKPLIIDIDLTKTIAEQDEETIKALLELIS